MRNFLKLLVIFGLLGIGLCTVPVASADNMGNGNGADASISDDVYSDLPPADLAGWFLNINPSAQWTSAANITAMDSWLRVVAGFGENPALLSELAGLGMITSHGDDDQTGRDHPGFVPEPATLVLFGGALAVLAWYAVKRRSQRLQPCSSNSTYVSLRRTDRSLDN